LDYLTTHTSLSPIWRGFAVYKKGCTQHPDASDKVYQLLVQGRWFSLGTPASSTTETVRHDIAESGVKHNKLICYLNYNKIPGNSFNMMKLTFINYRPLSQVCVKID
jgi:hypothetical protein